jgi:membrane-bound lytic murein transglycosylase D
MKKATAAEILGLAFGFLLCVHFPALALTPPSPSTLPKNPPPAEWMDEADTETAPSSKARPSAPAQGENLKEDEQPATVIKPPANEIREKVILELKELEKKGEGKALEFPLVINDQVEYFIDYFQTKMPKRFSLWLSRLSRYEPIFKKILKEHDLPEDLIYLAMIESGFSPKAYSRAHAVGPWQFIRETGERYGLKVNAWVDERKDPIKSTKAAAKHLADLYNRFGSWYLAAAGYNAGEGKISKALAMYNATNFWDITADHCRYIKEETKQYVPKMIAAALIAKEPEKYGFANIRPQPPLTFEEVTVPGNVELRDVASILGVDVETLTDLNPELRRWITPPGESEYTLRIPEGTKEKLLENYALLLRPKARVVYTEHRVKKGERLAAVARRYRVKSSIIARVNKISPRQRLYAGQILLIPVKNGKGAALADAQETEGPNRTGKKKVHLSQTDGKRKPSADRARVSSPSERPLRVRYKVKKGETLFSIAEKFDLDPSRIRAWNKVKGQDKLLAGRTLTLYLNEPSADEKGSPSPKKNGKTAKKKNLRAETKSFRLVHYTVKRGDSLAEIAQRFHTTPDQIRSLNQLSARETIKPGDRLKLKKAVREDI